MQALYYGRDGTLVSRRQWEQLSSQPGCTKVEHAAIVRHGREVTVATFWLGAAGPDMTGVPLVFGSYGEIRHPGGRQPAYRRMWGWPGLAAARAGHRAVLASCRGDGMAGR